MMQIIGSTFLDYKSYISGIRNKIFGVNTALARQNDILAMQYLSTLSKTYFPWTTFSMRPSGIVKVINEIITHKRSQVIECGSGISTFYIASILREKGGHIYTVEHSQEWADTLRKFLQEHGLSEFVSIITVSLSKSRLALGNLPWYDENTLLEAFSGLNFDLLLVDGPPAFDKSRMYARYPAVPYFKDFLMDDFTIILDDINRRGEKEILAMWENYLGIQFERYVDDGSIAIGRSKNKILSCGQG